MDDMKINHKISQLVQDVQNAITDSDKNVLDNDYIDDVNRRVGEVESAITALKHELTKHGLNDW